MPTENSENNTLLANAVSSSPWLGSFNRLDTDSFEVISSEDTGELDDNNEARTPSHGLWPGWLRF